MATSIDRADLKDDVQAQRFVNQVIEQMQHLTAALKAAEEKIAKLESSVATTAGNSGGS